MPLGVRAHDSAIVRAANWIKSNSCLGMFRSRPLKDTWVANRGFYTPSTTRWELNRRVSADCDELLAKGAEKAAPCRQGRIYFPDTVSGQFPSGRQLAQNIELRGFRLAARGRTDRLQSFSRDERLFRRCPQVMDGELSSPESRQNGGPASRCGNRGQD